MIAPEHPYKAIVSHHEVYGGDDAAAAVKAFHEGCAQVANLLAPPGDEVHVLFQRGRHSTPGNEGRPVIEAHVVLSQSSKFIGALYGVSWEQWVTRKG